MRDWLFVTEHRVCRYCDQPFHVGRKSGVGIRLDAKFCCVEHRIQYNNEARTPGRLERTRKVLRQSRSHTIPFNYPVTIKEIS